MSSFYECEDGRHKDGCHNDLEYDLYHVIYQGILYLGLYLNPCQT